MSTLWVLHGERAISPPIPGFAAQHSPQPLFSRLRSPKDVGAQGVDGEAGPAAPGTHPALGRGAGEAHGDFWRGEAAALPLHGPLAAQGEAGRLAGSKVPSGSLSYMAGGEAKAPLRSKPGQPEAPRMLVLGLLPALGETQSSSTAQLTTREQ